MKIDWSNILECVWGCADGQTKKNVDVWRKADEKHEALYQRAKLYYAETPTQHETLEKAEEMEEVWLKMRRRLEENVDWNKLDNADGSEALKGKKHLYRWQRYVGIAASVAVLLAVGIWLFVEGDRGITKKLDEKQFVEGGVVLIEDGGEPINVENLQGGEQLSYMQKWHKTEDTDMDAISKNRRGKMHTVVVPRGKTFELELSDGTRVLLNPESEITYPVNFGKSEKREVTLLGEAFFEVAKSERQFVVHTGRMKVQVYGTAFNVVTACEERSVDDEVVLVEGSVGVIPLNSQQDVMMNPGECLSVSAAGKVTVGTVDVEEYIAKRNGYILFNGKTISEILYELERYYDVNFTSEEELFLNEKEYVVSVSRKDSLREVLDVLELISNVKYTITGKEVEMSRN